MSSVAGAASEHVGEGTQPRPLPDPTVESAWAPVRTQEGKAVSEPGSSSSGRARVYTSCSSATRTTVRTPANTDDRDDSSPAAAVAAAPGPAPQRAQPWLSKLLARFAARRPPESARAQSTGRTGGQVRHDVEDHVYQRQVRVRRDDHVACVRAHPTLACAPSTTTTGPRWLRRRYTPPTAHDARTGRNGGGRRPGGAGHGVGRGLGPHGLQLRGQVLKVEFGRAFALALESCRKGTASVPVEPKTTRWRACKAPSVSELKKKKERRELGRAAHRATGRARRRC